MAEDYPTTIIIRRPSRITTDRQGNSVWDGVVEESELELMSTQALEVALVAGNAKDKESIKAVAGSDQEGILVRECATGLFRVVAESNLQAMVDDHNRQAAADELLEGQTSERRDVIDTDELSLASTQILRNMLKSSDSDGDLSLDSSSPGFNPYNRRG